ncbi:hypothetical protein Tsp_04735 [Trichinella spiralis]|uniref:hypothetical protein n=1 Tax=Trichinella spiralis TaxID=6334 RepID=UPI0001EFDBDE|nr:hypothetical protein Tsp_04735 [Trichinella spiralis]
MSIQLALIDRTMNATHDGCKTISILVISKRSISKTATKLAPFYLKNSKKWRNKSIDLRLFGRAMIIRAMVTKANRFVRTLTDAAQHQPKILMACSDFQNSLKHCPEISKCGQKDPKRVEYPFLHQHFSIRLCYKYRKG